MKKLKQLIRNLKYLSLVDLEGKLKPPTVNVSEIRRVIKNHGNPDHRVTKI